MTVHVPDRVFRDHLLCGCHYPHGQRDERRDVFNDPAFLSGGVARGGGHLWPSED